MAGVRQEDGAMSSPSQEDWCPVLKENYKPGAPHSTQRFTFPSPLSEKHPLPTVKE